MERGAGWSDQQVASLHAILEDVKRDYNVDENRVVVSGVSDGGTGAYYVAMRDTTPYASFLPLNGYVLVLRSPEIQLTSSLFLNNLRNKPLFVVNGGKDPLYPMDLVEPSLGHMKAGGVPMVYRPQPEAGHDTSWWPAIVDDFENFVRTHPRVPLPDTLTWEVSETRTWNRAHWLIVDKLGATPGGRAGSRRFEPLGRPGGVPQRPVGGSIWRAPAT
jgi:acetyl esterase/lipase